MVVSAGRQKCGPGAVSLGQLESENALVESHGPLEVGHLEMHVADGDAGINRAEIA